MKKILGVLFLLCLFAIPVGFGNVYAQESQTVSVCANECSIFAEAASDSDVLFKATFGTEFELNSQELFISGELSFYQVKLPSGGVGYILSNAASREASSLNRGLDPNAKILNHDTPVYSIAVAAEENLLTIDGENIKLNQYQEVKIIDGYDKNKEFNQIMFEINGTIYTGFVKSSDLIVEGFNGTIILIIFIFLLVASIILSIILTTRKKRKKAKNKAK